MQMRYAFWDPRDVEIVRAIKHFPNVWRMMREILQEWYDSVLDNVNQGGAFSENQPACHGMSS